MTFQEYLGFVGKHIDEALANKDAKETLRFFEILQSFVEEKLEILTKEGGKENG